MLSLSWFLQSWLIQSNTKPGQPGLLMTVSAPGRDWAPWDRSQSRNNQSPFQNLSHLPALSAGSSASPHPGKMSHSHSPAGFGILPWGRGKPGSRPQIGHQNPFYSAIGSLQCVGDHSWPLKGQGRCFPSQTGRRKHWKVFTLLPTPKWGKLDSNQNSSAVSHLHAFAEALSFSRKSFPYSR